jgi:hypothetical protein
MAVVLLDCHSLPTPAWWCLTHRHLHTAPGEPGALKSSQSIFPQGPDGRRDVRMKETFAGEISGLKHHFLSPLD